MKTSFAKVAGGLALMALSSVALASVVNTKHNLGATNFVGGGVVGSGGSNHTDSTTEICIFCHTPHGGDQTTDAPIWNRARSSGANYQRFSDMNRITFDAKEAPIGSVSAACLSCHDGTQAMDALINTSGSDTAPMVGSNTSGVDAANGVLAQNGFSQGQRMGNGSFTAPDGSWDGVGTGRGDMVYLGTDLRNDHPISMQYGGGGIYAGSGTLRTNDPDFAQVAGAATPSGTVGATGEPGGLLLANGTARGDMGAVSNAGVGNTTGSVRGSGTGVIVSETITTAGGSQEKWYVDTGTAGYQSTDFPLYSRTDVPASVNSLGAAVAAGTLQPTVECGTCHDPHSANSTFLRLPGGNQSSQVCLTCHAK